MSCQLLQEFFQKRFVVYELSAVKNSFITYVWSTLDSLMCCLLYMRQFSRESKKNRKRKVKKNDIEVVVWTVQMNKLEKKLKNFFLNKLNKKTFANKIYHQLNKKCSKRNKKCSQWKLLQIEMKVRNSNWQDHLFLFLNMCGLIGPTSMALSDLLCSFMILYGLVWPFVVIHDFILPFLAVIDPN